MSFQPPDRTGRPGLVGLGGVQQGYLSSSDILFFPTFDDDCFASDKIYPRHEPVPSTGVGVFGAARMIKSELDVSVFDEVVDFAMASQRSPELDTNSIIHPSSENIVTLAPPEVWSLDYLVDLSANITSTPNPRQTFGPREEQDLNIAEDKLLAEFLPDAGYGSLSPLHEFVRSSSQLQSISNECSEALPKKRKDLMDTKVPKKKRRLKDDGSSYGEVSSTPEFSKDALLDIQKLRQEDGTWVECCEPECGKWRYLKDILDPSKVPQFWTCSMLKMSCSEAQVECEKPDELVFVKFTSGSMVWAKSEGNPWWPAMIDDDPDTGTFFWPLDESGHSYPEWYNVTFIHGDGSVTRGWVLDKDLRKFDEENPSLGKNSKFGKSRKLRRAVAVAQRMFSLDVSVRREKYSFVSKFQGAWTSATPSQLIDNVEEISPQTAS